MLRLSASVVTAWYVLGVFLLGGDFSLIGDLRTMYSHCKATEDRDMDPCDFITDHLVNIDAFFDTHPPGDDQRPHRPHPAQQHTSGPNVPPLIEPLRMVDATIPMITELGRGEPRDPYQFDFLAFVFRPPAA